MKLNTLVKISLVGRKAKRPGESKRRLYTRGGRVRLQVAAMACVAVLAVAVPAGAQRVTTTVSVGSAPFAVAVNPVTNQIYVANDNSNTVTVINGATNATTTVSAGSAPSAVAANPVTNQIYVTNAASNTVTVINGATNATTTVSVGTVPQAVAVNAVTNQIYVANYGSNTVTVIDGATNATTTVSVGSGPFAVAVNPVTNQIYVANLDSNTVTVINGATNATTTVSVGSEPGSVTVNPVTNKIYVANTNPATNTVTVIDGATNATTTVSIVGPPGSVTVNPVTNKIYVPNQSSSGTLTVIDGATNATTSLSIEDYLLGVAVNPITNQIYVGNTNLANSNNVTVLNGETNAFTATVNLELNPNLNESPGAMAINPVTNKIYVAQPNINTVVVIDGATNSTTFVSAGTDPEPVAVNPVTNEIYVGNYESSNTVVVIDGATDATTTVNIGASPYTLAVNPITNQIYVADYSSATVTVIDGTTNATTTVNAGTNPDALAVNPVTNKIYVANGVLNGGVTVIDGATNSTTTINTGFVASALAVNPVTNKIYVANEFSTSVTVIDGATNTFTNVNAGGAFALAVNPLTNQIYIANGSSNTVTVMDGATNATTTVSVGTDPYAVAVNPLTNKIYVPNYLSSTVTVIDGATNATTTLSNAFDAPFAVTVNPVSNKIYVANFNNIVVIDGATNTTSVVGIETTPIAVALNPITNDIYAPNGTSNNVTVMDEQQVQPIPLQAEITPLAGNVTSSSTPLFNFAASSNFTPFAPNPNNLLFQVDTWQGPWTAATAQGNGAFIGTTIALQPGVHILYALATDGLEATTGSSSNVLISNITAYEFLVSPPSGSLSPSSLNFGNQTIDTSSAEQTVTLANNSGGPLTIASIAASGDYLALSNCPSTLDAGKSCTIGVSFTPTVYGTDNGTLTVTDDNLGVNGTLQTVSLTGAGVAATTLSLTPASLSFGDQAIATTSAAKKVTVKNTGTGQLTFSSITITGADAGDFAETNNCTGSIAPGKSCTVSVTFTPEAASARSASLQLTDDAQGSPQTVSLTGTGVAQVTVSPTSLTFATQKVGTKSAAKTVTLTNNLPAALPFSLSFTGADPNDFAATNNCSSSAPAKSHCSISVTFTPGTTGKRTATLNVNDSANNSPQTVSLSGTGD
jgi:YVTN family beta-propeller protein